MEPIDVAPVMVTAPSDDVRRQLLAKRRRDVHESGASGRHQPFVSMHREHVHRRFRDIEGQRTDTLRSIEKQRHPAGAEKLDDV